MIVAITITSESADHYLLLFKDKTVAEIKETIWNNENYYGASTLLETLEASYQEVEDLENMLEEFRKDSWNWSY